MRRATTMMILTSVLTMACGGQGTREDDMSADGHRRAAAGDEAEATEHESGYDPNSRAMLGASTASNPDVFYALGEYNPTEPHLALAQRLRDLAARHRAAAAALESFEEQECVRFPSETRPSCPLLGQVSGVEDVENGVLLTLAEGVNADAVADHMRCHTAYARTQGREGMDHCPLYVEDAGVTMTDRGLTLRSSAGAEAVAELRRRARTHVP